MEWGTQKIGCKMGLGHNRMQGAQWDAEHNRMGTNWDRDRIGCRGHNGMGDTIVWAHNGTYRMGHGWGNNGTGVQWVDLATSMQSLKDLASVNNTAQVKAIRTAHCKLQSVL